MSSDHTRNVTSEPCSPITVGVNGELTMEEETSEQSPFVTHPSSIVYYPWCVECGKELDEPAEYDRCDECKYGHKGCDKW